MSEPSMIEKWAKWLNITETSVVNKSSELHRLLQLLKSIPQINANNLCIICVDIAAEILGSNFDSSEAVLRSNLSQTKYLRQKRMVLKLLSLNKTFSCAEVCMQLNINKQVQKQAERLLNHYREQSLNDQTDFSHPQYVCMAIYMSCKQQKVKIKKPEILAKSTLKSAQWAQLANHWSEWMKKNEAILNERPVACMAIDEEMTTALVTNQTEKPEAITESYDAWRERMLKIANAELAVLQQQGI